LKFTPAYENDRAPGIGEERRDHIFERFYRAGAARTSSGFGLGLSIAKANVDGGTDRTGNDRGHRKLFYLKLPRARLVRSRWFLERLEHSMSEMRVMALLIGALLATGCAARSASPAIADVSRAIGDRMGHVVLDSTEKAAVLPDVNLGDGITDEEAVALALWNNGAFQADLASLGFSRADVVEAGLLRNPVLSLLFPIGPKQLESTFNWPVEAIWQRPHRLAAAKLDADRAAQNLVQNGLNLIRDTRFAHADAVLAGDRLSIAQEQLVLRRQVLEITEARFRAGDIAELEVLPARNDVRLTEGDILRLQHDVPASSAKLALLIGAAVETQTSVPTPSILPAKTAPSIAELLGLAFASRPDMRGSEVAIEAAGERARWQKSRVFALTAILDANGQGREGFESGPGVQAELFTADRNLGNRLRAEAELAQATKRYVAVRQQVAAEVTDARIRYEEARAALDQWRSGILPSLEEAVQRTQRAFAAGDISRLFLLENTVKLVDARNKYIEIQWSLRRARAELERAVGRRIELS
jgi:outer membrane protein, heavy metal efflux system